jgi:hypothetical protein
MVKGWSWYPKFHSYLITNHTFLFLQNVTNNGRRCVVSWSFRPTLSSAPPRQRRNLRDWREILRRSISSHHTSLAILQGIFEILRDISIFIFVYSTISRGALFGKNMFCMLNLVLLFLFGRSLIHRIEWAALEHAAYSWHAQRFALLQWRKT